MNYRGQMQTYDCSLTVQGAMEVTCRGKLPPLESRTRVKDTPSAIVSIQETYTKDRNLSRCLVTICGYLLLPQVLRRDAMSNWKLKRCYLFQTSIQEPFGSFLTTLFRPTQHQLKHNLGAETGAKRESALLTGNPGFADQ